MTDLPPLYVWQREVVAAPPAHRTFNLAYFQPDKVTMSFAVDFTSSGETYLDPILAFRINGEVVDMPDLPDNPLKLRIVKKDNIDVTKYIKSGPPGLENEVVMNYIMKGVKKTIMPWRQVGILTLYFVVTLPDVKEKVVEKVVEKVTLGPTKFCMSCQYSMPADANFCPKCGVSPDAFSGAETKSCVNCKETIPTRAKYCPKCGAPQPT